MSWKQKKTKTIIAALLMCAGERLAAPFCALFFAKGP